MVLENPTGIEKASLRNFWDEVEDKTKIRFALLPDRVWISVGRVQNILKRETETCYLC